MSKGYSGARDPDYIKDGLLALEEIEKNFKLLSRGELPKSYPNLPLVQSRRFFDFKDFDAIDWRGKYIENFGFPLFAEDWVKPLAKWIGDRPCLEIMAGTGYFSYALSKYGVKVKATDNYSWKSHFSNISKFIEVENLDCLEAIKKYGKDVKFIICSWPYMDNNAFKCLMLMRKINPSCRMIYIGESYMGCTADDAFFEAAQDCEVKGFDEAVSKYRRWQSIYDDIRLIK